MRAEKKSITAEYLEWLNASPFFIVVEYTGLTVSQFSELRSRLRGAGAELHVVKNSIFKIAAAESGVDGLNGSLRGQLAVVTGQADASRAAKAIKNFHAEFEKPSLRFGYVDDRRMEEADLKALADLPPLDVLRAQLLGTIQSPATTLVRLLNTPASQLAQVLKAKSEKGEG